MKTNTTSCDNVQVMDLILLAPTLSRGHAQMFESELFWINHIVTFEDKFYVYEKTEFVSPSQ